MMIMCRVALCVTLLTDMYSYGVSGVSSGPPMMTQPMQHPKHQQPTASSSEHHHPHRPPHPPPQQPRRPKHMLEIIDPNTGKNVLFGGAEQTAATDHPPAAAAAAAAATATLTATSATVINAESHRVSATVIFFLSLNNRKKSNLS